MRQYRVLDFIAINSQLTIIILSHLGKDETVSRLERLAKIQDGVDIQMSSQAPIEGVLFGYAFNVTRCEAYMECVAACVKENNLDRKSNTQYIRIFIPGSARQAVLEQFVDGPPLSCLGLCGRPGIDHGRIDHRAAA